MILRAFVLSLIAAVQLPFLVVGTWLVFPWQDRSPDTTSTLEIEGGKIKYFGELVKEDEVLERDWSKTAPRSDRQPLPLQCRAVGSDEKAGTKWQAKARPSDTAFISTVRVGASDEDLSVIVDTTSSDTWLKLEEYEGYLPSYRPGKSKTGRSVSDGSFEAEYTDGAYARGRLYLDDLHLDDLEIKQATIGGAHEAASKWLADPALSGKIGLARSVAAHTNPEMPTLINHLRDTLPEDGHYISIDLKGNSTDGGFHFGPIDENLYNGELQWSTPVQGKHWEFVIDRFRTSAMDEGDNVWVQKKHPSKARIDTGTELLLLPWDMTQTYWTGVPSARVSEEHGGWVYPCRDRYKIPDFSFWVEDKGFKGTVPGWYIGLPPIDGDRSGVCLGGIQQTRNWTVETFDGPAEVLFGTLALKTFFVALDLDTGSVGFADKLLEKCSYNRTCRPEERERKPWDVPA